MICTNCQAQIPTLKSRLNRVNAKLHELGLTYHQFVPYEQIDAILKQEGFEDTVGASEGDKKLDVCVGEGKWLHISWYRMGSGRYEVVAYVN